MSKEIKVLVVDDSSLVRKIVTDILDHDPEIRVVGTANNGEAAVFKNQELNPDIITMDIEMPIMDGLSALQEIIKTNPKPVIMMSVLTQHGAEATFKALDYGAVDFIPKPSSFVTLSVDEIGSQLISKVKAYAKFKLDIANTVKNRNNSSDNFKSYTLPENKIKNEKLKVVGIGTSTGGPSALLRVFKELPKKFPSPLFIVQHMPEGFTGAFANRLDQNSHINVKEAEDNDEIIPGHAYLAPGHSHMIIETHKNEKRIRLIKGMKVSGHMPSIDVLFNSLADAYAGKIIGVIMTGMGSDGADGMRNIRKNGGYTVAQDKETSVVYGMNRVAVENGDVKEIVSLNQIAKKIVEHI